MTRKFAMAAPAGPQTAGAPAERLQDLYRQARAAELSAAALGAPAEPVRPAATPLPDEEPIEARLTVRNIVVAGRRTSVRLEADMWRALCDIARRQGASVNDVCTAVAQRRRGSSLTAALRAFALRYFVALAGGLAAEVPIAAPGRAAFGLSPNADRYRNPAPRA